MRDYDPAIARWTGIDPVTHYSQSTYNAFDGNPVFWADPSGADAYGGHTNSSSNSPFAGGNAAVSNTGAWSSNAGNYRDLLGYTTGVVGASAWGDGNNGSVTYYGAEAINVFSYFALANGYSRSVFTYSSSEATGGIGGGFYDYKTTFNGVGQPSGWESVIPVWGSGRASIDHFQNGNYWRGAGYSALAISDLFLIKAAYTAVAKGLAVGGAKLAANRVFWSGEGALNTATNFAKSTGSTTLEMTRAGQNLQNLITSKNIPWAEARPMWQRLSTVYAQGASGTVHFFPGTTISSGSIWLNTEKDILLQNGVKIINH